MQCLENLVPVKVRYNKFFIERNELSIKGGTFGKEAVFSLYASVILALQLSISSCFRQHFSA